MSESEQSPCMAFEIPRGHAVRLPDGENRDTLYFKAERQGTDYIHHYLIQIDPMKTEGLALIYVDPEELLIDTGGAPSFEYSGGEEGLSPGIGHIFENVKGTYLKVIEDPKSQKMFAFIDVTSGEVKRRQERNVKTVYPAWAVTLKI